MHSAIVNKTTKRKVSNTVSFMHSWQWSKTYFYQSPDWQNDLSGLYKQLDSLREMAKQLFQKLYTVHYANNILSYFDPDVSITTDTYSKMLDLGKIVAWLAFIVLRRLVEKIWKKLESKEWILISCQNLIAILTLSLMTMLFGHFYCYLK